MQPGAPGHQVLKKEPLKMAIETGIQRTADTIHIAHARKCFSREVKTYLQALKHTAN